MVQLYIYMYLFFFKFFSHLGYYRIPSRVPCAIQQALVYYYVIFSNAYMLTPNSQLIPTPWLSPLVTISVFYICDSASVLCISSFVSF